jgi:pSer/pThr/pTyr-binding forkhead associated (FHA) protein
MAVMLKVRGGKQDGRQIKISQTKKYLIGRGEDCHLRPRCEQVGRHHCALMIEEPDVTIRDLGSANGTFVNGERVHFPLGLKTGDLIRVGTLEFEVFITSLQPQDAASQGTASHVQAASDIAAPIGFGFKATIAEDDGPIDLGGRVPRVPPLRFDPLVRPQDIAPGGPAA